MRDLVFKNLTSNDRMRKKITSSEIVSQHGVRSVTRRHFVCLVREVKEDKADRPLPNVYVLKIRNKKERIEKFFCKIKGSVYAASDNKVFLILFMHTLKISIKSTCKDLMKQG